MSDTKTLLLVQRFRCEDYIHDVFGTIELPTAEVSPFRIAMVARTISTYDKRILWQAMPPDSGPFLELEWTYEDFSFQIVDLAEAEPDDADLQLIEEEESDEYDDEEFFPDADPDR